MSQLWEELQERGHVGEFHSISYCSNNTPSSHLVNSFFQCNQHSYKADGGVQSRVITSEGDSLLAISYFVSDMQ